MLNLNSKILKVSGKVELSPEKKLENGQAITLICQGQIVKVEEPINQDGTYDKVFKVKVETAEIQ